MHEIFSNKTQGFVTYDAHTIFEMQNQRECYYYLLPLIVKREPITIDLVKRAHYELTRGCYDSSRWASGERPGTFKRHQVYIGGKRTTAPEFVESKLYELLKVISNFDAEDIVYTAAMFHSVFESIHPFSDGNGRTGRTLLNYFLMLNSMPPVIIYNADKEEYYSVLRSCASSSDYSSLQRFIKLQTIKTWAEHMGVIRESPPERRSRTAIQ